jgi:hypothetical protein
MSTGSMNLIFQPIGSVLCGQTCVAMILKITIDEAARLIGHYRGTHIHELETALASRRLATSRRRGRADGRGIIRIRSRQRKQWSHFAVVWDGRVYDPEWGLDPNYSEDWYVSTTVLLDQKK